MPRDGFRVVSIFKMLDVQGGMVCGVLNLKAYLYTDMEIMNLQLCKIYTTVKKN